MENDKLNKIKEEIKQKQITTIKAAVKETYELLEGMEKQKNDIQNKIRMLKHTLFDLKDGRLDRILERQGLDPCLSEIDPISVKLNNSKASASSPWYVDYDISVRCAEGTLDCTINNSITKMHASGAYKLNDGTIRNL